jgi:uncharacterized protein YkwD
VPSRSARLAPTILSALLLAAALVSTIAAPAAAADGVTFLAAANAQRAAVGTGPVALHPLVDQIAVERGHEVAAAQQLGHDFPALIARFAELGICWEAIGEIVARNGTGSVATFINQWMNSTVHRTVMLDPNYTHAGGYSMTGADGRHYAVMVFARVCGATPAPPPQVAGPGGFYDTHGTIFGDDITWLVQSGITTGCASGYFCPTSAVTREQMASFLTRASHLPPTAGDYFVDDATSGHQPDINSAAESGVTRGCAQWLYCPGTNVTREQMATFLARALNLPATAGDFFVDDAGSPHEGDINRLAAAGITTGCAPYYFCPSGPVTREEMSGFLHRAFD